MDVQEWKLLHPLDIKVLWLQSLRVISKVDYSSGMMVVEYLVYREEIILKVMSSESSCSKTLSKNVRDCLFIMSARWTGTAGGFRYNVKVFIKTIVSCY